MKRSFLINYLGVLTIRPWRFSFLGEVNSGENFTQVMQIFINRGEISIITKMSYSGLKDWAVLRWLASCFRQQWPHIHRSCSFPFPAPSNPQSFLKKQSYELNSQEKVNSDVERGCCISEREKTPSINRNPSSPTEREEVSVHWVFTAIWKEDIIKETSETWSLRAQKASKSSSNASVGQAERQHIHPGASELSISLLLQAKNYDLTNRNEEKKKFRTK